MNLVIFQCGDFSPLVPCTQAFSCKFTLVTLKSMALIAQSSALSSTMRLPIPPKKKQAAANLKLFWAWAKHPWDKGGLVLQPKKSINKEKSLPVNEGVMGSHTEQE